MKKRLFAASLTALLLLLPACTGGQPEPTFTTLPAITPSPVAPEQLTLSADVDGDGAEESLVLEELGNGTAAALRVDDEDVMEFTSEGAFDKSTCSLAAADMDGDGRDEVLVLLSVPARWSDAAFRYVELEDGAWRELKAPWPTLKLTLSPDWQCTLTDGMQSWTTEVRNPLARANWFDESGAPVAGPMEVGAYTERPQHMVEDGRISFQAWVTVRDLSEAGQSRPLDMEAECTVTVTVENGALVMDDGLCQALLGWLGSPEP